MAANQDLYDLLECPVCLDPMYPPIYQCRNGHTICSNCKPGVRNCCPTCRDETVDIRSLALEKLAASLLLPCRYYSTGCSGLFRYDTKQQHEQDCRFRPHNCPYPCSPCMITGDAVLLAKHLQKDHGSPYYKSSQINSLFHHINQHDKGNASSNVNVYNCLGEHFCLYFEAFPLPQDIVYMAFLTFMGEEKDAMNFRYSLEVGRDRGRIEWEGMPRSTREGFEQIRESYDGLLLHCTMAKSFAESYNEEELRLRVRGRIWREEM